MTALCGCDTRSRRWPHTFRFCGLTFHSPVKRSVRPRKARSRSARSMFGIVRVGCSYLLHAAVTANRSKCKRPNSETFKHHWQTKDWQTKDWPRRSKNARNFACFQSCAKLCQVSPGKFRHLRWRSPGFGENSKRQKSSREAGRREVH